MSRWSEFRWLNWSCLGGMILTPILYVLGIWKLAELISRWLGS